ncbi:peptidase S8/S53 domain-containing protein [Phascolomyces articulosus]|uniref:Peptidase S8/S53 domain-containing protein n=1 Tax=Phascolomyces articulosus TaxID=60185 RepID=A0AAD5P9M8_9FUNG|nr:peptidase S8/S53 domain-containing protein [Phascolomyces articulosus]
MERQLSLDHISIDPEFVAVSGIFPDNGFIDTLYHDTEVDYIEPNYNYKATFLLPNHDSMMTQDQKENNEQQQKLFKKRSSYSSSPDWGLARINKRTPDGLDSYEYDTTAGSGIEVFVLDSGVNVNHKDFEGRAIATASFVDKEDTSDLGGHGTHVAGKIAGKLYGVAKSANIHSVKILNRSGDGTMSNLIKGISHVIQVATPGKAIINLSLSGPKSKLIDEAVSKLVNEYNIPVFVSAGNSGTDACYFSPSSNPDVFSVGATDINDQVPYYSDTGSCVKIYAPGSNIKSTWIGEKGEETKVLDGTSMANPHVVGIAASLMSKQVFNTPQELYQAILSKATSDMLKFTSTLDQESNNNLIAYNDIH